MAQRWQSLCLLNLNLWSHQECFSRKKTEHGVPVLHTYGCPGILIMYCYIKNHTKTQKLKITILPHNSAGCLGNSVLCGVRWLQSSGGSTGTQCCWSGASVLFHVGFSTWLLGLPHGMVVGFQKQYSKSKNIKMEKRETSRSRKGWRTGTISLSTYSIG